MTHYQRPGLRRLGGLSVPQAGRGIWRASNGNGFCVIGANVYFINPGYSLTQIGTLAYSYTTPCSFVDNGTTGMLVDGSPLGYTIDLASNAFSQITDPTGVFTGADRVDTIDTFILWNTPGTRQFGSTLSGEISFDALYFAAKTNYPDPLATLIVCRHEIILLGQVKSEPWYDAGGAQFPFAELPGGYYEHGTCAKYSVASSDISVFFLGQDLQGQGVVFRIRGYDCSRISNHALEYQIRKMRLAATITDATGYVYQLDGHYFYVLSFPAADQTWVFDDATSEWHQIGYTDASGNLHRERLMMAANIYNRNVGIDWQTGDLLELDPNYYFDDVSGSPAAIPRIRTFPHIGTGEMEIGADGRKMPMLADGRLMAFTSFTADMECGNGELGLDGLPPQVTLRWSDDRGKSWGNGVLQSAGRPGEYSTWPIWRSLGSARDRVFELSYSFAGEAALNGAWVEARIGKN